MQNAQDCGTSEVVENKTEVLQYFCLGTTLIVKDQEQNQVL